MSDPTPTENAKEALESGEVDDHVDKVGEFFRNRGCEIHSRSMAPHGNRSRPSRLGGRGYIAGIANESYSKGRATTITPFKNLLLFSKTNFRFRTTT